MILITNKIGKPDANLKYGRSLCNSCKFTRGLGAEASKTILGICYFYFTCSKPVIETVA